jgi:hypothetical protein
MQDGAATTERNWINATRPTKRNDKEKRATDYLRRIEVAASP